jgi:23S rRNA pseudouridine2605 synthase
MVFKRPRNSRDDKSGRSSNRASKADDRPKRSPSSRGNSKPGSDQTNSSRPSKKYSSERSGEKKSFSSSGSKPYQSRQDSGDKPASSFSGGPGEKKAFSPGKRPYTGRAADSSSSGEKKAFAPKGRPYTGRIADNDARPPKSFGGESTGGKKPFSSRSKSPGSFGADDRPKRSFGGESSGEKKSYGTRSRSQGSSASEDRPKRSFSSDRPGDKKFTGRSSAASGGFKKEGEDRPYNADRPQRSKTSYPKITPDTSAPAKTLRGRKKATESKDTGLIRLNRYISNAGICSRRKADELIVAGVVSVNGVVVSELGHKVDPQKDDIRYNGELLKREKMVYVLLNKPKDYITTTEDPQERRTVMHLVEKASKERIYPIGRLDRNTTGLLLMTNDGDLADKLSHPRNSVVKLYQVELNKSVTQGDLNKIGFGLELEDGLIKPDSVSYVSGGTKREIGIQIHSGKNRIVRRIFEHLGYEIVKLDRVVYANLTKKDLPRGRWRFLEESEVIQLKHLL